MKKFYSIFGLLASMSILTVSTNAQAPTCDPIVPFYQVDLTGQPAGSWDSPAHYRDGNCCGTTSPDRCTSFEILLDTQAVALSFDIASGAIPTGSMFYQINCGPQIPVGELICISGPGPHYVTFCKPGNNENTYVITSIPEPIFPQDDSTRDGCSKELSVLGLDTSTVTWNTVYPGNPGDYNNLLSCTSGCTNTMFTPVPNGPAYFDIEVCGFPQADECGLVLTVCDTFRLWVMDSLDVSITPDPGTFCQLGPGSGVTLTASAMGGGSNYQYTWYDTTGTQLGTGSTFYATNQQEYIVDVNDGLVTQYCSSVREDVAVIETQPPTADAGPDQMLCADSPETTLSGTITYASGGVWSGGNGTYIPGTTSLTVNYIPTSNEINTGFSEHVLTSTGQGGSCPAASDTVVIYYADTLEASLSDESLNCATSGVTLNPSVTGGYGSYSYVWNTGETSSNITVSAGNYCVSIEDDLGCATQVCANVTAPSALSLSMSSVDVTVDGGSDGEASASPSGGVAPYSYTWMPSGNTQTITGLSYGIYDVIVTDANGCTISGSVVVNEPRCAGFDVNITNDLLSCFGDANGQLVAEAVNGTGPYSFVWDDAMSQTNDTATSLVAGTYSVIVSDANSCYTLGTGIVSEPAQLTNTMNHTDVSSVGGNDGSATANASGGTGAYNYSWSNGFTTSSITSLTAGTYSVMISDANGCTYQDSVNINEPPCDGFFIYTEHNNVSCFGGNDGDASVTIVGGTAPLSIDWSNGSTTSSINNLTAGSYTVEVSDDFGCYTFATVAVTEPSDLSGSIASVDPSCYGTNDGTLDLSVAGGTYPYLYDWSNGVSVQDQVWMAPGSYDVTVTDANGCTTTASANLAQPTQLTTSKVVTPPTCYGYSDGAIDLTVNGGSLPYSYDWSNGATTQDITGISSALFTVQVTDGNNCNLSSSVSILVPEPDSIKLDTFTVDCPAPGADSTMVYLSPTGGNGNYYISYNNGFTFQGLNDTTHMVPIDDSYYIIINDTNNCSMNFADTISIDPKVVIDSITFDVCFADGTTQTQVEVFPNGGDGGPYTVSYDAATTYMASGNYTNMLPIDDTYVIQAVDGRNCPSVMDTILIPDELEVTSNVTSNYNGQDISCNGLNDGEATSEATGGTTAYTYEWSDGQTTQDAIGLSAGTYSVIITDANGCMDTSFVTITEPDTLDATLVVSTDYNGYNVSCYGSTDGAADMSLTGGVTPYSYNWSNGMSTEDIGNVGAGTYYVTAQDANGCLWVDSVIINQPDSLIIDHTQNNVQCNGFTTGWIDVTVSGGVPGYDYNWANGMTTSYIDNLPAGSYALVVTDTNGCTKFQQFQITEESPLYMSLASTNLSCYQSEDGTILATVSGGVEPYNYDWSHGDSIATVTHLSAGEYEVTVTDSFGCYVTDSILVTQPDSLWSTIYSPVLYNGHNLSLWKANDGEIDLEVFGGTTPYNYNWNTGDTIQDLENLAAGSYNVIITDLYGCSDTAMITLTEPFALELPTVITPNADGRNDMLVVHGIESFPDNTISIYNRWGSLVYQENGYNNDWDGMGPNGGELPVGTYYVVLTLKLNGQEQEPLTGYLDILR